MGSSLTVIAKERINSTKKEGSVELNLSNCNLSKISLKIIKFQNLKKLGNI